MAVARVKWVDENVFLGIDSEGRAALMSSGQGPGVSPMQMLLLGLGGCSSVDVVNILQKQHQPLVGVEVLVDGARAQEFPKAWERIHMHYVVSGAGLDPHKVERAIQLSVEKYCGAHATLAGVAHITHDFEIREVSPTGAPAAEAVVE